MVAVLSRPARARPRAANEADVGAARNDHDSSSATTVVHHKIRPMNVRTAANPHRDEIKSGQAPAMVVQVGHAGTVPQAQLALPPTALTADAGTAVPLGLASAFQDTAPPTPRSDEPSVPWGGIAVAIVVALVIISGCVVLARIRRRGQQNQAAAELAAHATASNTAVSTDAGKTKVENVVASHEHLLAGASPEPPMAVQTTGIPVHPTGMPMPPPIGMPITAGHPTGVASLPPRPISVHSTGAPAPAPWNMPVPPTMPMIPLAMTPPAPAPIMQTGPYPPPMPATAVPARTFVAVHSYVPQARDELPLRVGDRVAVVVEFNDGWAKVVLLATGEQGFVPMTLVVPEDAAMQHAPMATGPVYAQRYASLARGGATTPSPPPGAFPRPQ
ncbi:hypothetical protein AMAG_10961 [Allomyces macrogynus ATCC 38327]|uniref:SH3 domain-containing protein n=1 Tax=Allomyces macrogynus (strain ATCC 38327) TaxID=578462 RepID=A0A0L0SSH1_ALLM3|nr:hypothetical protein AMAG_10961 [Allomyces macrogynus ATCC 38327]|eukprot:KNE65320.1 hypothetical protein AMAG_10961 [Allomyces macrogynus ATCC 38327]